VKNNTIKGSVKLKNPIKERIMPTEIYDTGYTKTIKIIDIYEVK